MATPVSAGTYTTAFRRAWHVKAVQLHLAGSSCELALLAGGRRRGVELGVESGVVLGVVLQLDMLPAGCDRDGSQNGEGRRTEGRGRTDGG